MFLPRRGAEWAHDQVEALTKKYGGFTAVDDVTFTARPGPGHRLPRPQRRRQVHHHADHGRADPGHSGSATDRRPAVSPTCPTPGREVGVLLDASAQHAGRTGREILTIAPAHHGAADAPGRRDARPGQPDRRPRPSAGCATTPSACGSGSASPPRCIGDPEVLILDEPANGLDPAGIRWMRDLLRELRRPRRHRAALLAPAARDRGHRRRPRRHRQRPDRRPGHQGRAAADRRDARPRRATASSLARALTRAGRRRAPPSGDGALRTDADPDQVGKVALAARRRPHRAARRRRRRPRGDVPRAHRRHPTRRSSGMSAIAIEHDRSRHRSTRPRPADPDDPAGLGRAAQDVRHPLRLLADGEHRDHRRCSPPARVILFAPDSELTYATFAAAIGVPDGGHPADDRDPVGDQRVEPAQRADDVHAGAAPRPGDRRQGWSSRSASASSRCSSRSRSAPLGNVVGYRDHRHRHGVGRRPSTELAYIVLGQRARPAGRLHARRADPQLRRRDRGVLRLLASCCRRSSGCSPRRRTGSRRSSRGSTSTSPRAPCSTAR